jgi:hypothetical protein
LAYIFHVGAKNGYKKWQLTQIPSIWRESDQNKCLRRAYFLLKSAVNSDQAIKYREQFFSVQNFPRNYQGIFSTDRQNVNRQSQLLPDWVKYSRKFSDILAVSNGRPRGFDLFVYVFNALRPRCCLGSRLQFFAPKTHEHVFLKIE